MERLLNRNIRTNYPLDRESAQVCTFGLHLFVISGAPLLLLAGQPIPFQAPEAVTFLVKYDLNGNFGWGEWNEASPNSIPHGLALASDSADVAGWFEGVATFHRFVGLERRSVEGGRGESSHVLPQLEME